MAIWPSVNSLRAPSYGLTEEKHRPTIQTEFEANYVQTRRRFPRTRGQWTLVWNHLPEAEYVTLDTFVNSATGDVFGWTHPVTTTVHTCTIYGNIRSTVTQPGFRSATIDIGEI